MSKTRWFWLAWLLVIALALPGTVLAQGETPPQPVTTSAGNLTAYAKYPQLIIGANESATFELVLQANGSGRTVRLSVAELPEGWEAVFRGGIRTVAAAYLPANETVNLNLQVTPPKQATGGDYTFYAVIEDDNGARIRLPLTVTIKGQETPKLSLEVDLPTLRGSSNTTFRYNLTVRNESAQDLTINLQAEAAPGFLVRFTYLAKEITAIPIEAGGTKRVDVEVRPIAQLPAGEYPISITATGGGLTTATQVVAVITGEPRLFLSLPDGRLSGRAQAGQEAKFDFVLQNNGTAAAHNIELSASAPGEWEVTFDPQNITELDAGQQATITVTIRPSAQAVAGDYIVTLRARSEEAGTSSTDFRITVTTSTLWGAVGLGVIAIALLVIVLAVARFGRR